MHTTTTRDGRRLAYHRTGTGPLVVAHPGGPGFGASSLRDLGGLAAHVELVVPDPRGTGGSDAPEDGDYGLDGYVDDLADLLAHLGDRPLAVLGHSHGGIVALLHAARHAAACDHLVVIGTPSHLDADRIDLLGASTGPDVTLELPRASDVRHDGTSTPARLMRLGADPGAGPRVDADGIPTWGDSRSTYEPALDDEVLAVAPLVHFNDHVMRSFDLRPVLGDVATPTTVVCGRHDVAAPPADSRVLAARLPTAELAVIEGSGHVPYVENPPAFRHAVLHHLGL